MLKDGDTRGGAPYDTTWGEGANTICGIIKDDFLVNDDTTGVCWHDFPAIAVAPSGNFVICWGDRRNGLYDPDIYAQRYSSLGDPLSTNFRVNNNNDDGSSQRIPSIAMGADGGFVICWEDYRNGDPDIFAQRSHSDGTLWGANYIVNQRPIVFIPDQIEPSVGLNDDRIVFAWIDARRSEVVCIHWDIYAKVVTWDWVKVDEPGDNEYDLPKDYALLQNYPNPFNVTTIILYSLPDRKGRPYRTDLKIFNVLGEVVRTLVDEDQAPGDYEVLWNGKDDRGKEVGSGVYLCQLRCGIFSQTRKLVLVR